MKRYFSTITLLLIVLTGCDSSEEHRNHAHGHGDGLEHDHSGGDEHVDKSLHLVSFTEQDELYLQYEPLVAGHDSVFLAHFTHLNGYRPIPDGFTTITLSGGEAPDESFTGKRPVRDGIHIEVALPTHAGKRELIVALQTPTYTTTHHLGRVTVHPADTAPTETPPRLRPENAVYLEKEAQWQAGIKIERTTLNDTQQLVLPTSALHHDDGEMVVFVMQGAEFFARRVLKVAQKSHDYAVISEGLKPDETVVVRGGTIFLPKHEAIMNDHRESLDAEMPHNH